MAKISRIEDVPVEKAKMPNVIVSDTYIQWLITREKDDAPNFAMRRFVMKPGGFIGLHDHPNEHEIFILSGEGVMFGADGVELKVSRGNFIFDQTTSSMFIVPPNEPHGYRNDGNEDFVFLCLIPNPE